MTDTALVIYASVPDDSRLLVEQWLDVKRRRSQSAGTYAASH